VKRLLITLLLGGMLASSTGCGLLHAVFSYRPCVSRGDCGPGLACGGCDEGCGSTCGPTCGPRRPMARRTCTAACETGCDEECGAPCGGASCGSGCDPCGRGCSSGRCWHRGPLSCVFALLMHGSWWGPSCGERYWGDFYSDPPDCWDPCDGYGNYSGGGGDCGCDTCGGTGGYSASSGGGCRNCGQANSSVFNGYADSRSGHAVTGASHRVATRSTRVAPAPKPVADAR
jgi:hypothetical protein